MREGGKSISSRVARRLGSLARPVVAAVAAALALAVYPPTRLAAQSHPRLISAVRLAQEGQGDSARADLRRMLDATAATDTLYPQILYTMGMVADRMDDRQRLFQRVVIEYSTSNWADEALFRLAQVAYASSDWSGATRYLERIRSDFPGSPLLGYAALYAARAQFQAGNAAAACQWVSDGLDRARDDELKQALEGERRRCTDAALANAGSSGAAQPADNTRAPERPATSGAAITAPGGAYRVQIAAVGSRGAADEVMAKLRDMRVDGVIVQEGSLFKVRAGPYRTRDEAERAAEALRARFGGQPFIVAAD